MSSISCRFALLLLMVGLGGCAPNVVTYFRPEVRGGEISQGRCVPTQGGVNFDVGPVSASVAYLAAGGQRKPGVWLRLHAPVTQRIAFASASFVLNEEPTGTPIPVRELRVLRDDDQESLTVPYGGEEVRVRNPDGSLRGLRGEFTVVLYTDELLSLDSFTLQIPPLLVNAEPIQVPPVHFRREVWAGFSPLNC